MGITIGIDQAQGESAASGVVMSINDKTFMDAVVAAGVPVRTCAHG